MMDFLLEVRCHIWLFYKKELLILLLHIIKNGLIQKFIEHGVFIHFMLLLIPGLMEIMGHWNILW